MQQYQQLLLDLMQKGTAKDSARANMPQTRSIFGYQFRHNLQDGFPAITTKELYWKGVVAELIWFMSGDTNIKYLDDCGARKMWHQDAYNYYCKLASKNTDDSWNAIYLETEHGFKMLTFEEFCKVIKTNTKSALETNWSCNGYTLGDCGMQYGKLWRNWPTYNIKDSTIKLSDDIHIECQGLFKDSIDQLSNVIAGIKQNPESRRHIMTSWNPATLDDMALNACHALVQFNCRPIPWEEKLEMAKRHPNVDMENLAITEAAAGNPNFGPVPQYYLDCQMYQRSADVFLGVPLNIASYALLTNIIAKMCNMIPGDYIHTFGDVHLYDNHIQQINLQLSREPFDLPTLKLKNDIDWLNLTIDDVVAIAKSATLTDFASLENYKHHDKIIGALSTGLVSK